MTYKKLGKSVGFSSPVFLRRSFRAKSRLPHRWWTISARALELTVKEQAYFKLLAEFGQTKRTQRKTRFSRNLINMTPGPAHAHPEQNMSFLTMVLYRDPRTAPFTPFNGDFHALAKGLAPRFPPAEAREAIALLLHLKMIGGRTGCFRAFGCRSRSPTGFIRNRSRSIITF